eukprot:gene21722-24630_t
MTNSLYVLSAFNILSATLRFSGLHFVAVRPSQVPEYLRTSGFFQGLNVTDDDEFLVPSNHMKVNTNVDTLADMTELLNTIRFWGSDILPQAMIDFAAHQSNKDLFRSVLEPFCDDLKLITTVCSIIADDVDHNVRLEKAMESGNIDVVHYFHNKHSPFSSRAIALAAGQGALDCLDYALTFKFRYNAPQNLVFSEAVRNGHMNSILYLRQKGFCHHFYTSPDLVEIAAASGQLVVLKYLCSQKCSFHSAAIAAADAGHFDCLVYALTNGAPLHDDPPYAQQTGSVTHRLARAGLLEYFQVAISSGFNADTPTALIFARSGNLEYLQLSIDHGARPSVKLIASAAQKGHLDCLKFLHQLCSFRAEASGNGLDWRAYAASVSYGSLRFTDVALSTASAQQWECLWFLITHGCTMNKSLTTCLIQSDQIELYHLATFDRHACQTSKFFQGLSVADDDKFSIPSNYMKLDTKVATLTDMTAMLATIRFWGSDVFPQAMFDFAAHQPYFILKPILEPYRDDLPFIVTVCSIASSVANSRVRLEKAMECGMIEVVKYFHKNEIPFSATAIAMAAGKEALNCLEYAL